MTVVKTTHDKEIILSETITIADYQGDELSMLLIYDSTEQPQGLALLEFVLTDKGQRGTYVSADDVAALADILKNVEQAMRVVGKPPPKLTRRR